MKQDNFRLRKKLDLIQCEKSRKSNQLIRLRNSIPNLDYEIERNQQFISPDEAKSRAIFGKINVIVYRKNNLANFVRGYDDILQSLKMESMYLGAAIEILENENYEQQKRMYQFIKSGQAVREFVEGQKADFSKKRGALRKFQIDKDKFVKKTNIQIKVVNNLITDLSKRVSFYRVKQF